MDPNLENGPTKDRVNPRSLFDIFDPEHVSFSDIPKYSVVILQVINFLVTREIIMHPWMQY